MTTPIQMLAKMISRNPLRSQRQCCTVAARRAIAAFGPVLADDAIRNVSIGLAWGLFGEAYADASEAEQKRMSDMMEEEYRKALGPHSEGP